MSPPWFTRCTSNGSSVGAAAAYDRERRGEQLLEVERAAVDASQE
jgi:hypothetical protein